VNEAHRDGFGLDGQTNRNFFEYRNITTQANGDYDSNNDGQLDSTALFKISGNNSLDLKNKINLQGTITLDPNKQNAAPVQINYFPTDTVEDVINRINQAGTEVVAYLDHKGSLALKATLVHDENNKHFIIRHVEDSGDFLVNYSGLLRASGTAGAYDWKATGAIARLQSQPGNISLSPLYDVSSWVKLEQAIKDDVNKIAAAGGTDYRGGNDPDTITGMGDGSVALNIANIRYKKAMIGEHATFDDYYTALISETGALGEQAKLEFETTEKLAGNLENLRKSINGVNMDEEMANMVTFQHGYNASARFISVIDKMLETIITRMGV
ncbi:MAG: flagellar basal body rod C-terminal domain-containing protein, partial [bacterium]|nr:flagellar basal body rod C-terminal domain-containing protein [bacterium]